MKKYRLLLTLFIFSIFTLTTYAQDCDPDDPDCGPPPPGTNVPGKPSTPIDDYAPILIVTAVTIAGYFSYRQRQVIKK
ncbi:hypothetical protein [Empedobacter falsenii]|uniref:Signal peptidase n=1 Tax=Empedobacter falsenii TaxID=343874 RepID=A0AAW7DG66_9FLAO|nr:hypothetical protein [Empedobacter falsenii]MDM1549977.1 hypothetical protein [Empedobacter falsenii]